MTIDELLSQAKQHSQDPQSNPSLSVPKTWTQGRTLYGGISAALLYAAIKEQVSPDRVMRAFSCNFVGPLNADSPFHIDVEVLREGKNASQVLARIVQDDKVAVVSQVCFGVSRESKVKVMNRDSHSMEIPNKAKFIPQIPKVTPKFLRYFDLSIDKGGLPFTGNKSSELHGWMRYKQAPQSLTDAHLIGLIDAWPPTVLQMLKWPAPASTMSWNIEFIHPHAAFSGSEWFAYQACTRQAMDGYAHTEANIWDQRGQLIAISRQAVGVFD